MKIQRERLLEIIKEEIDWARPATTQVEEQELSPWQKLAGMIQEAGAPQLSLPKDLVFELIEYLQDMSGLKLKGSDFIARRARELLAKMDTGDTGPGALQEAMDTESVVQQIEAILNELSSQGLDNEELKKILSQIIHDIDKGFVGERT